MKLLRILCTHSQTRTFAMDGCLLFMLFNNFLPEGSSTSARFKIESAFKSDASVSSSRMGTKPCGSTAHNEGAFEDIMEVSFFVMSVTIPSVVLACAPCSLELLYVCVIRLRGRLPQSACRRLCARSPVDSFLRGLAFLLAELGVCGIHVVCMSYAIAKFVCCSVVAHLLPMVGRTP